MILVTGGLGFLGVHTARALLDAGASVLLTKHRATEVPDLLADEIGGRVQLVQADLRDADAVRAIFDGYPIDGVIHLAVPPRAGMVPSEELSNASAMFLPTLAAAVDAGLPRVVMASSLMVYEGLDSEVWSEEDPINLRTTHPIAAIKRSEEALASYLAAATDTSIVRARISFVWGPLYRTRLNVPSRLALLAAGRADALAGLPDPRAAHPDDELELVHVTDCARALALLATTPEVPHDVYNVSTGRLVRYGDLVDAANDAGSQPRIELQAPDRAPTRVPRLTTDRLESLGFRPGVDVATGMADYVGWLRGHEA